MVGFEFQTYQYIEKITISIFFQTLSSTLIVLYDLMVFAFIPEEPITCRPSSANLNVLIKTKQTKVLIGLKHLDALIQHQSFCLFHHLTSFSGSRIYKTCLFKCSMCSYRKDLRLKRVW